MRLLETKLARTMVMIMMAMMMIKITLKTSFEIVKLQYSKWTLEENEGP